MKPILTFLCLCFASLTFGQKLEFDYHKDFGRILEESRDEKSDLNYDKLLKRFNRCDTTLTDFETLALLIGFTANKHFKPYSYIREEREIYDLNDEGKFEEALKKCEKFLKRVPVSQAALIESSYACFKLGRKEASDKFLWQFDRIMHAMYNSGEGTSPDSAFFSLGPADGQNFIRKLLQSSIGVMGSGRDSHGNFVDILEMVWEDNETGEKRSRTLYFQIQHATSTMFDGLDFGKSEKEKPEKKKRKKDK